MPDINYIGHGNVWYMSVEYLVKGCADLKHPQEPPPIC